jgi:hypothetical protein
MRIFASAKSVLSDKNGYRLISTHDGGHTVQRSGGSAAETPSFYARATMFAIKLLPILVLAFLAYYTTGLPSGGKAVIKQYENDTLQDIVTWDEHSIMIRGERIMLYNGEFHPFRLPVPSLWLDVFQKIKAAGFSGVSFYVDW